MLMCSYMNNMSYNLKYTACTRHQIMTYGKDCDPRCNYTGYTVSKNISDIKLPYFTNDYLVRITI